VILGDQLFRPHRIELELVARDELIRVDWPWSGGRDVSLSEAGGALTQGYIHSSPAIVGGVVYIGSTDGRVYAFDAATGQPRWVAGTGARIFSSPTVANGVVYIGSQDHRLYALNAATGAILWTYTTGDAIDSSPTVANGMVYVGSWDGKLYAFHL